VDGVVIVISAFLGYSLAGITLRPIQRNHEIQKRFMSDTSHELRTPLSIMKTGLEVQIRNPECPPECKPVLSSNLEEVNRMSEIVGKLLFISRMDSGSEIFRLKEININELLKSTIQNIQDYAREKKIDIIFTTSSSTENRRKVTREQIFINGDLDKLKQAFFNILKNAVDYSGSGGKIELTVVKNPRFIQIEIKDYGSGIPKADLPYVFERFYRSSNAAALYKEGSGLGLAITKEIILKHKGEIKIESSYGNWTKVIVVLPVKNI
jgi:signal transduction histidine kinase